MTADFICSVAASVEWLTSVSGASISMWIWYANIFSTILIFLLTRLITVVQWGSANGREGLRLSPVMLLNVARD